MTEKKHSNVISSDSYRYGCHNAPRPVANAPVLDKGGKELGFNFTMSTDCRYDKRETDTACRSCAHTGKSIGKLKTLEAKISDTGLFAYWYSWENESSEHCPIADIVLNSSGDHDIEEIFYKVSNDRSAGFLGYRYKFEDGLEEFIRFFVVLPDKTGQLWKVTEIQPDTGKITQVVAVDDGVAVSLTLYINSQGRLLTASDTVTRYRISNGKLDVTEQPTRLLAKRIFDNQSFKYDEF